MFHNIKNALNLGHFLVEIYSISYGNLNKAIVFRSSPVNMSMYTSQWENLTSSDFICGCTTAHASAVGGYDAWSVTASPTFSYNPSSGILSFASNTKSSSYNQTSVTATTNGVFVVWLGTVSGI